MVSRLEKEFILCSRFVIKGFVCQYIVVSILCWLYEASPWPCDECDHYRSGCCIHGIVSCLTSCACHCHGDLCFMFWPKTDKKYLIVTCHTTALPPPPQTKHQSSENLIPLKTKQGCQKTTFKCNLTPMTWGQGLFIFGVYFYKL